MDIPGHVSDPAFDSLCAGEATADRGVLRAFGLGDLPDAVPEYLQAVSGEPEISDVRAADQGPGASVF